MTVLESFELTLEVGNSEMRTPEAVADALEEVARKLRDGYASSSILDVNGNSVGGWYADAPKPQLFAGLGAISDLTLNTSFLESIGVDPEANDDTEFPTETVYCSSHMRIHPTGWCTVPNSLKLPNDSSLHPQYREA